MKFKSHGQGKITASAVRVHSIPTWLHKMEIVAAQSPNTLSTCWGCRRQSPGCNILHRVVSGEHVFDFRREFALCAPGKWFRRSTAGVNRFFPSLFSFLWKVHGMLTPWKHRCWTALCVMSVIQWMPLVRIRFGWIDCCRQLEGSPLLDIHTIVWVLIPFDCGLLLIPIRLNGCPKAEIPPTVRDVLKVKLMGSDSWCGP